VRRRQERGCRETWHARRQKPMMRAEREAFGESAGLGCGLTGGRGSIPGARCREVS
jgi:hypothetical protein